MATRGRPKSDQKRQQILAAAGDLFSRQGYESTSLDQIALAAGVSKQTIYSHFTDKADVLRQGVKRRCEEEEMTPGQFDYSLPPETFLPLFADRFIRLILNDTALRVYRLCLNEGERHPEVGESFFESGPLLITEALTDYLERATGRGELAVPEPRLAAAQFLYMVRGMPVDAKLLNLPEDPHDISTDRYIESCCEMFLRAHRPRGER